MVDGEPVRYFVAGSGEPVLLLHGLGGSGVVWYRNLPVLAQHHRVYAPDLWGPGRFTRREPYSPAMGVKFVTDFLDSIGCDSAHLVGSSLGGLVAANAAVWASRRALSLTLVDSAGLGREIAWSQKLLTLPGVGELLFRPSRGRIRKMLGSLVRHWDNGADDLVEELYQDRCKPGVPSQMLGVLRSGVSIFGVKRSVQLLPYVDRVNVPSLIVWGSLDPLFPVMHARRMADRLPDARLHVVEGSGHWPYLEYPDEFNELLLRFFAEQQR